MLTPFTSQSHEFSPTGYVARGGLTMGAFLCVALPSLIGFDSSPSATFFNQAAALVGWGLWASMLSLSIAKSPTGWASTTRSYLWAVLAILMLAAGWSAWRCGLPSSLMLSGVALLAGAGLALTLGSVASKSGWAEQAFTAFSWALLSTSVLNSLVACVQVFAPQIVDGVWLAGTSSAIAGRAGGNLRQPNHLASLLLWGLVAWVWLQHQHRQNVDRDHLMHKSTHVRRALATLPALLLCLGMVLTGSRTGLMGLLLLALWGWFDRRLARSLRLMLVSLPVIYGLMWLGWSAWANGAHQVFGGEGRFNLQGDVSASRFGIWSNSWELVWQHPWAGVGWGNFNFAWSLTPFPGRPTAFFDHAHNLPLHFAVELGLPMAVLLCLMLGHALWRALLTALRCTGDTGVLASAAAFMVLTMAVHSQLEYPLWYAYFLLPTAFVWGLCLSLGGVQDKDKSGGGRANLERRIGGVAIGGILLAVGGGMAVMDYLRTAAIYAPDQTAVVDRIRRGQTSLFSNYWAHYAIVVTNSLPAETHRSASIAAHNTLDTPLMTAWAESYAEQGDLERARHLAQRLREFNRQTKAFEVCDKPPDSLQKEKAARWRCVPPTSTLGFEDFLY